MQASNSFSENQVDGGVVTDFSEQRGPEKEEKEDKGGREKGKKEEQKNEREREGQGGRQAS